MSMANDEFKALQRYEAVKQTVQETLDLMEDDEQLAALVASSTRLATAIAALATSVKYRTQHDTHMGSEAKHAARTQREERALRTLNKASADKTIMSQKAAQDAAVAAHEQKKKLAVYQDKGGYPTLGQAQSIQPNNKVYVPQQPKPFTWEKPQ